MRSTVWLPASLLALACWSPSAPGAVLQVNIERPVYVPNGQDQVLYFDAFVTDIDNTNERLNVFTVAINGIGFSPTGVRFQPPVQPPGVHHPYVFAGLPNDGPRDIGSTATRLQVASGLAPGAAADVGDDRNGLFRIPVFIPANAAPGAYVISVDPTATQFGSANQTQIVATPGNPGVIFIPEPSALGLLALPAVSLLRRRAGPATRTGVD